MNVPALLEIEDLHVSYGRIRAVQGVSLTVPDAAIVALIGANGAGKSTLLRTISGIVRPGRGTVPFLGEDLAGRPAHRFARRDGPAVRGARLRSADGPRRPVRARGRPARHAGGPARVPRRGVRLSRRAMPDLAFLAFLVVDGALAGAIYALAALAFVVVYKASRMINFAVGEWVMLASRMVASGLHGFGFGLGGALGLACVGMVALAMAFNRVVLRRLFSQSLLSSIMVTIGLGILLRGSAAIVFAGIPSRITSPVPLEPLVIRGVPVSIDKLVAAMIAGACIIGLGWFFHGSRTGLALRAIATDQQVAMAVGIGLHRHFAIALALVGWLSVVAAPPRGGGPGRGLRGRRPPAQGGSYRSIRGPGRLP